MANGLRIGIVLSGTAPAMTLMSGVMLAFAEQNVQFQVISTTGAGGLIGLLALAPRARTPIEALKELPNFFVSDWLYRLFPVNFKLFHKHGPFAQRFYDWRKALPKFDVAPDEPAEVRRLFNDLIQFWATALTPPSLDTRQKGLMSHVGLVQDLVDFDRLKQITATKFYLNTFSLWSRRLRIFDNTTMTPDAYNAAQALFMLFPPVRIGPDPVTGTGADLLTTGATRDPTGLQALWMTGVRAQLDAVLALDPVTEQYWRMPENAYDAFQLMLMNPVAALQQLMFAIYANIDLNVNTKDWPAPPAAGPPVPRFFGIPLTIEASYYPRMLEWTHDNAITLQNVGHAAAAPIAAALRSAADDRARMKYLERFRFGRTLLKPRAKQFLRLFAPAFENYGSFVERAAAASGGPPEHTAQPAVTT